MDGGEEVVVDRQRNLVGEQGRLEGAGIIPGLGVVDVGLHGTGQRRGQRMGVIGILAVILMKGFSPHGAIGRVQQGAEGRVAELDDLAAVVLDRAELQVGVVELAEYLVRRLGHFGLHGQQVLFLLSERVRLVAKHPLEDQLIGSKRRRIEKRLHFRRGDGQDLRADEAGRLGRAAGDGHEAAMHPLVLAFADVLGRLQEGIVTQALRRPIEIEIKLQAACQRLGAFGQLALKRRVVGKAAFPGVEGRLPGVVGGEEAGEVPGVGGFDFAARGKLLGAED